jgi:hypothetical protein
MKQKQSVGYGSPPVEHQFSPGVSGNPLGRPRGRRKLMADLLDELSQQIHVSEAGAKRAISKQQAIAKTLVDACLEGDFRALALLASLVARAGGDDPAAPDSSAASAADSEIVEAFDDQQTADNVSASDSSGET